MTELRLEGVTFDYPDGTRALDGVDLLIAPGSVAGAGRRQRQRQDDAGTPPQRPAAPERGTRRCSTVTDTADLRVAQLARSVGLVFQQPDRQIFGRTVRDEVEFGPASRGRRRPRPPSPGPRARSRAVGMADDLGTHPDDLGESARKLLTIASVLAMETPVVVLDEPTTGLDARGVELVEQPHPRARGRGAVLSSASATTCASWPRRSSDVVVLERGRITAQGTTQEVFAQAQWPTLRAAGLEPTAAALIGARLGLGSTPTEGALVEALRRER